MSASLFNELKELRGQEVPVILQSGTRRPNPAYDPEDRTKGPAEIIDPTIGTKPIKFKIHSITANEMNEAEAFITAKPRELFEEQPNPKGVGMVNSFVGYDYQDPNFILTRDRETPKRDAVICLRGCTALGESTPGESLEKKIETLMENIPAAILEWLAREIGTISILTAVGPKDVERFLSQGSESPKSSGPSSTPSRASAKGKSSRSKTGRTSATKSGKRRGSGS